MQFILKMIRYVFECLTSKVGKLQEILTRESVKQLSLFSYDEENALEAK